MKSTVDEIRQRFDADVERFSNLETGQSATVDAPLAMRLVAEAAATVTPGAADVLDIGCGAGNYSLKLLEHLPGRHFTLTDLSRPMLDRATQRLTQAGAGKITAIQGDIRSIALPERGHDIIVAAAVLHHLRSDEEWRSVFAALHRTLRPGGSLWIFDMVESPSPAIHKLLWTEYGKYLSQLKNDTYRDQVFAYIEKEDSPRSLLYQLNLLRESGFASIDVLHKHLCFAAFGAIKG